MSKSNGTVREVAEYLAQKQAQGWKDSKSIKPRNWKKKGKKWAGSESPSS